jgi:argininosuccinate lyase
MLCKQAIISEDEKDVLINGLESILNDIDNGDLQIDMDAEDIHMFVEAELTRRVGDTGKKLHTARSRNDQVALDIRMYLREEVKEICSLIKDLLEAITQKAETNKSVIMPGYTHLQRAQPIVFAHHLLAYAMMFTRDYTRLVDAAKRMNVSPIGCCALAERYDNLVGGRGETRAFVASLIRDGNLNLAAIAFSLEILLEDSLLVVVANLHHKKLVLLDFSLRQQT